MTYEYMELTRQVATSHWGWTIAFFLWFVGLSGMSLTVNYWLKSRRLHYLSTAAALAGTLHVVSHLARMLNLPMAAINALVEWKFNFTSWMFIGICILAVLCVVTILQAWVMRRAEKAGERLQKQQHERQKPPREKSRPLPQRVERSEPGRRPRQRAAGEEREHEKYIEHDQRTPAEDEDLIKIL